MFLGWRFQMIQKPPPSGGIKEPKSGFSRYKTMGFDFSEPKKNSVLQILEFNMF